MSDLAKLRTLWIGGAIVLFVTVAILGVTWALASGAIGIVLELLGYSSERVWWWVAFAAPIWAPLQVGMMLRTMPRSLIHNLQMAGLRP